MAYTLLAAFLLLCFPNATKLLQMDYYFHIMFVSPETN